MSNNQNHLARLDNTALLVGGCSRSPFQMQIQRRTGTFALHNNQNLRRYFCTGFTFLEVLFAVMILGIGFIMAAAMFPATVRQTQSNVEDQASTAVVHYATRTLNSLANDAANTPTADSLLSNNMIANQGDKIGRPIVYSFNDPRLPNSYPVTIPLLSAGVRWKAVCGNFILPTDSRFGWAGMYSRDWVSDPIDPNNNHFAQAATLYIVPVRSRNKPTFTIDPSKNTSGGPVSDLSNLNSSTSGMEPVLCNANINFTVKPNRITITTVYDQRASDMNKPTSGNGVNDATNPAVEGAWVIVSDSKGNAGDALNGATFHLGNAVQGSAFTYEIAPDPQNTVAIDAAAHNGLKVFVVGRGIDPTAARSANAPNSRAGSSQAIGVAISVVSFVGPDVKH